MKKYISLLCLLISVSLSSCFKDNTTFATDTNPGWISEIKIEGLKDTAMVAYAQPLQLAVEVPGFTNDELEYAWYIYGGQYGKETGYRANPIGAGNPFSYPIELKIGYYTIVCEVTHKESGYFTAAEFDLNVTSDFSQGFYALKETVDGNTELDFYNHLKQTTRNDLITEIYDASLSGKPRNMNVVFDKTYIDSETAETTNATAIFIAYGNNNCTLFNTIDMSVMFDRTNLHYGEMDADEIPCAMATYYMTNFYFSNKGINADPIADMASEYATGQTSYPVEAGGSSFIQPFNANGIAYWSESERCLMYTLDQWGSFGGCAKVDYDEDYTGLKIDWTKATPVASGWNAIKYDNTVWFLFDVAGEGRYMVILDGGRYIREVRLLNPSLHIAKAEIIAGQGRQNNVIYCIDNNLLYRYSVTEQNEVPLSFSGLGSGTITYLSNLFFKKEFDYIVVGVQDGDKYTVAMYEIEGGQPSGLPKHIFGGTGSVKKVGYVIPYSNYLYNAESFLYGNDIEYPY